MKLSSIALLIAISLSSICYAQDKPQPNRWRGLVLNQSTPADAIRAFGTPNSDKTDRIRIFNVPSKWITKKQGDKIFRKLKWEKLEAMDSAELSFLDDKLVLIYLDPKEEPAAVALGNIYGIEFAPLVSGFDEAMSPANYERNQGRVYPKRYPPAYSLIGVAEHSFVGASVNNGIGSAFKDIGGVNDTKGMPGKVNRIEIVSRTLENRDGADALK